MLFKKTVAIKIENMFIESYKTLCAGCSAEWSSAAISDSYTYLQLCAIVLSTLGP